MQWLYFDTTVYKCLHGLAPKYLADLCVPVAEVAGRRQLCSASRWLLDFPRFNMSNYGRRAFSFAGPHSSHLEFTTWSATNFSLLSYVQTLAEDIFIWADYAFSALETILNCLMGYISACTFQFQFQFGSLLYVSESRNFSKAFSTLRDRQFFRDLAHISGKTDQIFIKFLKSSWSGF